MAIAGNTDYKNEWLRNNKERINLVVDKGMKDVIKSHAEQKNQSVNEYINQAIDEAIEKDSVPPANGGE